MRIVNETLVTRNLMGKFCFSNMFYRMKYILVLFPLLIIGISLIFTSMNSDLESVASIVISISVAFPVFIVAVNVITFGKSIRNFPIEGKLVKLEFSKEGFYTNPGENEKLIGYEYIKECVEFSGFFIIYFKRTTPIVLEKKGFTTGTAKEFKALMKESILIEPKKKKTANM